MEFLVHVIPWSKQILVKEDGRDLLTDISNIRFF